MADIPAYKLPNPITAEAEKSLLLHFADLFTTRTNISSMRSLLVASDLKIAREEKQESGKKLEVEVPIISPQVDTMVAFLIKTFLGGNLILPVTASPDFTEVADATNTLFDKFSRDWQWRRNLILAFKDAAKYNLMVAEATWDEIRTGVTNNPEVNSTPSQEATIDKPTTVVKSGFNIKYLNPYNTFWDSSVPAAELSSSGEFAGYIEVMSTIRLTRFLLSLPNNANYNSRIKDILTSVGTSKDYYVPKITEIREVANAGSTDWATHFSSLLGYSAQDTGTMHQVTTIYCWIIPANFKMRRVPSQGTPQLWKFIVVNNSYIVYAAPRNNSHAYLPIVVGVPNETNLGGQQKTIAEELGALQSLASNLWSMEIASNRRILSNRELYNPQMIDPKEINNPSPTAKIAIKPTAIGRQLSEAIHPIPYNDPAIGTRSSLAQGIMGFATMVTGQNQVSAGEFVKGNKTNQQFNEVLNRSDARQLSMAILLNDQFFSVVQYLLLKDFQQYQGDFQVRDLKSQKMIAVNATQLSDAEIGFVINDALSLSAHEVNPEIVTVALQTIQAIPQLAEMYDISKIFNMLMSSQGFKDIDDCLKVAMPPQQVDPNAPPQVPPQVPQGQEDLAQSLIDEAKFQEQIQAAIGGAQ